MTHGGLVEHGEGLLSFAGGLAWSSVVHIDGRAVLERVELVGGQEVDERLERVVPGLVGVAVGPRPVVPTDSIQSSAPM